MVWVLVIRKPLLAIVPGTSCFKSHIWRFCVKGVIEVLIFFVLCGHQRPCSLIFLKVAKKPGRSLHQGFQQKCISLSYSREVFREKHVCLQTLLMSSSCCVCPCFPCSIPSNSEKQGSAQLHLHTLFCICKLLRLHVWRWSTALESSACCLYGLLKGLRDLKTTLLSGSFAPVIAISNSSQHPRVGQRALQQPCHDWISPCQALQSEQMVFKPHLPQLASLPPGTAQTDCTARAWWFYSERS